MAVSSVNKLFLYLRELVQGVCEGDVVGVWRKDFAFSRPSEGETHLSDFWTKRLSRQRLWFYFSKRLQHFLIGNVRGRGNPLARVVCGNSTDQSRAGRTRANCVICFRGSGPEVRTQIY